ncbi:MAG: acetyl-CoA carboxylase biotin carboxylase subunit [Proteobacteria bacterium]|nr:acetyl-CoA carboxylase biotin carboxylase subunit [Pseudomonadota bacterium]NDC24568.1 acetyl-CoA carboxylase biotin carboxylase subunit [Pseudomonadota bacterium]NDD04482.1 acetyl-CoA carboxylase biotin carboxylase subunit [Pseudomonadota bacterium]
MRACREMGHTPLAVYSKADRYSLHVAKSDGAYCVGEGPSIHSYLDIDSVLKAAKALKADAIHPGYGFLSEKAEFAKAVAKAGLVFVGPSAEAIATMGDKVMARQTMAKLGHLPLVPGTKEGLSDENEAFKAAKEIGFPVMIKALAGGGGRGMRVVNSESEFINLFRRAFSEAQKAFGDGRVYLEKYVTSPHHIEVQVIADSHGNAVHLFERECSVQRRHQKIIEESPSPFISPDTRKKLCEAAVRAVKDIGYVNAGTIEMLVDENQNFYFMEMNTRLQVEHPVTEWTTGRDLVKEQLRVAFGEKLSFAQDDIKQNGHAMEFRICAEDPEKFLPQAGKVTGVSFPGGIGVRVDSHLYRGYEIPVFYDSMIAKLTVWGRDRMEAINRGKAALMDTVMNGVKTNIPVHLQLLNNPKFVIGNYTTRLIGEDFHYVDAKPTPEDLRMALISAAVCAYGREYKGGDRRKEATENSFWKQVGREEALR